MRESDAASGATTTTDAAGPSPARVSPTRDAGPRRAPRFVIDLALVVLFAVIGRASHSLDLAPLGVAMTAWPFAVGLVVGWAIALGARWPVARTWPAGVMIWLSTVAVGIALRVATGEGAATAFLVVSAVALALFLLAPRLLGDAGRRRRRRSTARPDRSVESELPAEAEPPANAG